MGQDKEKEPGWAKALGIGAGLGLTGGIVFEGIRMYDYFDMIITKHNFKLEQVPLDVGIATGLLLLAIIAIAIQSEKSPKPTPEQPTMVDLTNVSGGHISISGDIVTNDSNDSA